MKQTIAVFLLLVLLTGCTAPAAPTDPTTLPPATLPQPTEAAHSLMEGRTQVGDHLYRLSNQTVDELLWASSLHQFQDCLLIGSATSSRRPGDFSSGLSYQLQLVELDSGELRARLLLDGSSTPTVQICGDRIAVLDSREKTLRLYNSRLQEIAAYELPQLAEQAYLNEDATGIYFFNDGYLDVQSLKTGRVTRLLADAREVYPGSRTGDCLTFSYIPAGENRSRFACIDLATGSVHEPPYQTAYANAVCNGSLWLGLISFSPSVYFFGTDETGGFLKLADRFGALIDGPAPLLLRQYGETFTNLSLYRADGSCLGTCRLGTRDCSVTDPFWCEEAQGYFMLSQSGEGRSSLLFWTPEGENSTLELEPMSLVAPAEGRAAAQSLYDRAAAMSEQYGVTICIAEACGEDYPDFTAERMDDFWLISHGLDQLEQALSSYPAGFLPQLRYGAFTDTRIHLTGPIHPKSVPLDANGFTSFSAYVQHLAPDHIVVLDVSKYGLDQTIYHEFSHLIDGKLAYEASLRPTSYSEEGWAALNPEDFIYIWDSYTVPDSYRNDGYDSYFIDTYSRTFPTEDRARVMEYAMSGQSGVFDGPGREPLRQKLRYYSACIREVFDTDGWPEVTAWEAPLEQNGSRP